MGRELPAERNTHIGYIVDADAWQGEAGTFPAFNYEHLQLIDDCAADLKFMFVPYAAINDDIIATLRNHPEIVVISQSNHPNRLGEHRALAHRLMNEGLKNPLIIFQHYAEEDLEELQVKSAADMGALVFDGLVDRK